MKKFYKSAIFFCTLLIPATISISLVKDFENNYQNVNNAYFLTNKSNISSLTGITQLDIIDESTYKNVLINSNGDLSHGEVQNAIIKTFSKNVRIVYSNLNVLNDTSFESAFRLENLRMNINPTQISITCNVIPVDSSIFYFPQEIVTPEEKNNYMENNLTLLDFEFTGFNLPLATELKNVSGINEYNTLFPFEINNINFKNYLNFEFIHSPNQLKYEPNFIYDNINGIIRIDNIELNKYYNNSSYQLQNTLTTTNVDQNNFFVSGFKKAMPTIIEDNSFNGTNVIQLKNEILDYLINQNMVPSSYDINNITISINPDNRSATVDLNGYFSLSGEWKNDILKQNIILLTNSTNISNQINGKEYSNFSPYEIKYLCEIKQDVSIINLLKKLLIKNINNNVQTILPSDIEIIHMSDNNVNGTLIVDFNIINNKAQIDGNVSSSLELSTTIINLNNDQTSFEIINKNDLKNKAADYITNNNYQNYIKINNSIIGANYSVNTTGSNYIQGIETIGFICDKKIDQNTGAVVDGEEAFKIEVSCFSKLSPTITNWKDTNSIPYAIAIDNEYLNSNYIIQNENEYNNVYFVNDSKKVPKINNISIIQQDNDGTLIIRMNVSNFLLDNNSFFSGDIEENATALNILDGILLKNNDVEITNQNVYGYIFIQPLLWKYFNIVGDYWIADEIKEKMSIKGYTINVKNNMAILLYKNKELGVIKKITIIDKNNNQLNSLYIALIVVGLLAAIILVVFFIIYNILHKKEKKLKNK